MWYEITLKYFSQKIIVFVYSFENFNFLKNLLIFYSCFCIYTK